MLHNHELEKQQTLLPKGSKPKRSQAGKETHQKIPAVGQKDYFKCIWPAKNNN